MSARNQGFRLSLPWFTPTQSLCLLAISIALALWIACEPAPWHPPHEASIYESEHWLDKRYEESSVYEWYGISEGSGEQVNSGEVPKQETEESLGMQIGGLIWQILCALVEALLEA